MKLLSDPGFPAYSSIIEFIGAKAVPLRLRERMDLEWT